MNLIGYYPRLIYRGKKPLGEHVTRMHDAAEPMHPRHSHVKSVPHQQHLGVTVVIRSNSALACFVSTQCQAWAHVTASKSCAANRYARRSPATPEPAQTAPACAACPYWGRGHKPGRTVGFRIITVVNFPVPAPTSSTRRADRSRRRISGG